MPAPAGPAAPFVAELEQEAAATRRLLERLPAAKLGWRPHPRSMTLGQLAQHVAAMPSLPKNLLGADTFDAATADFTPAQPGTVAEVRKTFEDSMASARVTLGAWTAKDMQANWRLVAGPKELMAAPKAALVRTLVLNHMVHHRGQLTVYLRMLDVPLPAVYGPSADEQPFG
jgi:uncharacterized damage-inducible protein DinB